MSKSIQYVIALVFVAGTAGAMAPHQHHEVGALYGNCRPDKSCDDGLQCEGYEYDTIGCEHLTHWSCQTMPDMAVSP